MTKTTLFLARRLLKILVNSNDHRPVYNVITFAQQEVVIVKRFQAVSTFCNLSVYKMLDKNNTKK